MRWVPPWKRDRLAREAVGGHWDTMGPSVLEALWAWGLKPHHRLLDCGCGSLRVGRFLYDYLDKGNYVGFDVDPFLVKYARGVRPEAKIHLVPKGQVLRCDEPFDVALAVSVFTHLPYPEAKILRETMKAARVAVATFFVDGSEAPIHWLESGVTTRPFDLLPRSGENFHTPSWWLKQEGFTHGLPWDNPRKQKMYATQSSPE